MNTENAPDLEIYIRRCDVSRLTLWLSEQLTTEPPLQSGTEKKTRHLIHCHYQGQSFDILIMENVVSSFTSLWVKSDQSPWSSDAALAHAVQEELGKEVRYAREAWSEAGASEDLWVVLSDAGRKEIKWNI